MILILLSVCRRNKPELTRYAVAAFGLICLSGCGIFGGHHEKVAEPPREVATFTGKVVWTESGYRFQPLQETNTLRLTRAKGGPKRDLVAEEINLRKYFGKTLTVRGTRMEEWILKAQVLGQWLRPGEKRGSTLTGPEPRPN
jgi:hypothetical protein